MVSTVLRVVKIVKSLTVRKVVENVNEVVVQGHTCGTCRRTQNEEKGKRGAKRLLRSLALFVEVHKVVEVVVEKGE